MTGSRETPTAAPTEPSDDPVSSRHHALALTEAAQRMHAATTLAEALRAITEAGVHTVPGITHASVSVVERRVGIVVRAATSELARDLARLQTELHDGPVVDAARDRDPVVVRDARHEQRWPSYMQQAVRRGVRSQISCPLVLDDRLLGVVDLCSTDSQAPGEESVLSARLFATHAGIALQRARREQDLVCAVESRGVISTAVGIVMERYELDRERAFAFLVRSSQTTNAKLRSVAEEMVTSIEGSR